MIVAKRPHALTEVPTHYCPGCTHGIIHRLVAEAIDTPLAAMIMTNRHERRLASKKGFGWSQLDGLEELKRNGGCLQDQGHARRERG